MFPPIHMLIFLHFHNLIYIHTYVDLLTLYTFTTCRCEPSTKFAPDYEQLSVKYSLAIFIKVNLALCLVTYKRALLSRRLVLYSLLYKPGNQLCIGPGALFMLYIFILEFSREILCS